MTKAKPVTIASLVRNAAKSETGFVETINNVFEEEPIERIAEFFDRLNIPRSQGAEGLNEPIVTLPVAKLGTFAEEKLLSDGIQKFLDRHERKIKWHATHPSIEGTENVLLVLRMGIATTNMRLARLERLLDSHDELSAEEWSIARELMNRTFLSFRNYLNLLSPWVDAMQTAVPQDELADKVGNFYEFIDTEVRVLEEGRERIEVLRRTLTVIPLVEGYPPVKPPNYFGGDLISPGPWKQYHNTIGNRAHHFRESVG